MATRAKDLDRLLPWFMGVAASLFYLSFHSAYYNFDGIACAIAVELGDWGHLVHGNHLAYGVSGLIFDRIWRLLGYGGPAILPLQCLDSLLGGAGVGLFYAMLEKLRFPRYLTVGAAAGLAFSQCYWFWSLEAQVYLLGVVFVILTAGEALSDKPRPARLGFYHACAILGHVGHLMLLPMVAYRLWKTKTSRSGAIAYLSSVTITTATAYAAAAVFCVRPATFEGWRRWLLGSAALTVDRSFTWQGGYSAQGFLAWLLTSARLMVDRGGDHGLGLILAGAPLAAAAFAAWRCRRGSRGSIVISCLLWIISYAVLFSTWEPFLDVYRIPDLIPLWLLAVIALESMPARSVQAGLALWVTAAGIFNAKQSIAPRADAGENRPYQEALWIEKSTPGSAWIVVTARGQVYVPYFAHRKPLNMRYFDGDPRFSKLSDRLDGLASAGEQVYITEETLKEGGWREAFAAYGLAVEREEAGRILYRVKRKESPAGSRRKN